MQIIIVQNEIEEAIRNYILGSIRAPDGKRIDIDLRATRGAEGYQAIINIVPEGSDRAVVVEDDEELSSGGEEPAAVENTSVAAPVTSTASTQPAPVDQPVKRGRGRPPGSTNKPKPAPEPTTETAPVNEDPAVAEERARIEAARTNRESQEAVEADPGLDKPRVNPEDEPEAPVEQPASEAVEAAEAPQATEPVEEAPVTPSPAPTSIFAKVAQRQKAETAEASEAPAAQVTPQAEPTSAGSAVSGETVKEAVNDDAPAEEPAADAPPKPAGRSLFANLKRVQNS